MIPEVGKTYVYFDDGKISHSRRDTVTITKIIPFEDIDLKTKGQWEQEVADCHWLYAETTDYFIEGHLHDVDEDVVFVRTKRTRGGGWFSLGWWAGRLDVDGSLDKELSDEIYRDGTLLT